MKILNIEDFFHPEAGYQLNVLSKYLTSMGNEVIIVTSEMTNVPNTLKSFFDCDDIDTKDKRFEKKYNVKIIRIPTKRFVSGRAVYDSRIFNIITNERPDIVYVHGNTTLIAMQYLLKWKKIGLPFLMDCHMLEIASENRLKKEFELVYKMIFTPILVRENITIIRTQDDNYLQKCLNIPINQCPYISFGTDTRLFHPDKKIRNELRDEYSIDNDALVFLYAGKLDESKGGLLLSNVIKNRFDTSKEVVFLIIGHANNVNGCDLDKEFMMSGNRVIRLGTQKYEDLAKYYQMSDVALFPKQCSLSFFDVQACGLPVIFEDNNINIERAKNNNALLYKTNDANDFRTKIRQIIDMSEMELNDMKDNSINMILSNYSYDDIAKKYFEIMKNCYNAYYDKNKS